MGKYDPLGGHLRRQKGAVYEMTFRDIERVLGALLPRAAHRSDWWTNDLSPPRAAHRAAWLEAGYKAQADVAAERVRFVRPKGNAAAIAGKDLAETDDRDAGGC